MKRPIDLKLDDRRDLVIKVTITFEFITVWQLDTFIQHAFYVVVFKLCMHREGNG